MSEQNKQKGKTMKRALFALLISISVNNICHAAPFKIVALVNGEIISSEDMENRINAFSMSTKIPFNEQTKNMITQRVLNNAIDEKLKLQAAQNDGIVVSEQEVNEQMQQFEKENNVAKGELPNLLKKAGVSKSTMMEQIKSDIAWVRYIRKKFYSEGTPTQKEIKEKLQETTKDLQKRKYLVSEIYISKKNAQDIHLLVDNLRKDSRFELYAMQFSESPTAANGGNLGWIDADSLSTPLANKLKQMNEGSVSNAIAHGEGYYILKLQQTYNPQKDKIKTPTNSEIKTMLENQKMEMLSKKSLQDLRQKAIIEIRG